MKHNILCFVKIDILLIHTERQNNNYYYCINNIRIIFVSKVRLAKRIYQSQYPEYRKCRQRVVRLFFFLLYNFQTIFKLRFSIIDFRVGCVKHRGHVVILFIGRVQVLFWSLNVLCVLNFAMMFYRCAAGVDFVDAGHDAGPPRKSHTPANVLPHADRSNAGTQTSDVLVTV